MENTESELKILNTLNNSSTIIVSFGGCAKKFGGIQPFEFLNFLSKNYTECDKYFYIDKQNYRYHRGILGITKNIDETKEYLFNIIKNYSNVYFLGFSAGGYAAILFGSLLNVTCVIAFVPPTLCNMKNDNRVFDEKYIDLLPYINNTTKYHLFGNSAIKNIFDSHHISHILRLKNYSNVIIEDYKNLNMIEFRNNGKLLKIFNSIIKKQSV